MLPAGLMWSVVTESPTLTSTRAAPIDLIAPGTFGMSTKNGGSWMYVLASSQVYRSPVPPRTCCHSGGPDDAWLYSVTNISGVIEAAIVSEISFCDGQMSFRYTSLPA